MEHSSPWKSRLRALPAALLMDLPWSDSRSRLTPFFALIMAGTAAGALEGIVLYGWIFHQEFYQGDAFVWDAIEHFAWIGCAVGLSAGVGVSISRNLLVRVTLASLLGILSVSAAVFLYSDGKPIYFWGSNATRAQGTLLPRPEGWGLYLGMGSAAAMTVMAHLARRCLDKTRLLLLILPIGILLSFQCRSFFWEEWSALHYRDDVPGCGMSSYEWGNDAYPWVGAILLATAPFLAFLLAGMTDQLLRRFHRGHLLPWILAAWTLMMVTALLWGSETMAFTPRSQIECLSATSDSRVFVTAHAGETFRLWQVDPGMEDEQPSIRPIREFRIGRGPVRFQAYALSPGVAAAGSEDGRIRLWALPGFRQLLEIDTHGRSIGALAISHNGRYLAAGDRSSRIRLWELRIDSAKNPPIARELPEIEDTEAGPFYGFSLSPDGSRIITHGDLGFVRIYSRDTRAALMTFGEGRSNSFENTPYSDGGRFLAFHPRRSGIWVLDLQRSSTRIFDNTPDSGHPIAFSPDEGQLAISEKDVIRIVELPSGKTLTTIAGGWTHRGAYSSNGRWLATEAAGNGLEAWTLPMSLHSRTRAR